MARAAAHARGRRQRHRGGAGRVVGGGDAPTSRPADAIATVETEKAVVDVEAETAGSRAQDSGAPRRPGRGGRPDRRARRARARRSTTSTRCWPRSASRARPRSWSPSDATCRPTRADAQALAARRPQPSTPPDGGSSPARWPARSAKRRQDSRSPTSAAPGRGGRILRRDVDEAAARARAAPAEAVRTCPPVGIGAAGGRGVRRVPHSRMRRATARRLTESKQTVPHFYLRATRAGRRAARAPGRAQRGADQRVSVNDLVVKAVARGARAGAGDERRPGPTTRYAVHRPSTSPSPSRPTAAC